MAAVISSYLMDAKLAEPLGEIASCLDRDVQVTEVCGSDDDWVRFSVAGLTDAEAFRQLEQGMAQAASDAGCCVVLLDVGAFDSQLFLLPLGGAAWLFVRGSPAEPCTILGPLELRVGRWHPHVEEFRERLHDEAARSGRLTDRMRQMRKQATLGGRVW